MIIPLLAGRRTLSSLSALLGARVCREERPCRLVTRADEVQEGDLFCALRGKDDGHHYTREAALRGACAVLVEKKTEAACPHLIVPDVRRALALWASITLRQYPCHRVGITGSVGKTTTKNACAAVLSTALRTHATAGNFNNDLGLPFTILSMPTDTEVLVAELGSGAPGELSALAAVLSPHSSLITRIGHAHLGAFGTRRAIAEEKSALFRMTAPRGRVFSPADEPLLDHAALPHQHHERVSPCHTDAFGLSLEAASPLRACYAFASALGRAFGLPEHSVSQGIRAAHMSRSAPVQTLRGVTLIDDTYNASPESMAAALRCLGETDGRRIAVLGTMAELGESAAAWHRRIGRLAADTADILLFFGAHAADYAAGAQNGTAVILTHPATDALDIARLIFPLLRTGDTLLCKASRSEHAERVTEALTAMLNHSPKEEPPCL